MATEAEIAAAARARAGKERKRQARVADDLRAHGWTCIPTGAIDNIGPSVAGGGHVCLDCDRCGQSIAQYADEPAMLQHLIRDALAHTCQES